MSVFLVTGCSTGIGEAIVLHFARRGHRVYATMRTPGRSGATLLDAAKSEDLDIRLLTLDVTVEPSVSAAVERALEESGQIDVLVNNAGVAWLGSIEESPISWLQDTLETNVVGLVRVSQAVIPGMRERGSGAIVNIGSIAGLLASGIQGHYCASKYAVEAMSEAMAQELVRFGVRVVLIEPGFIGTPILEKALAVPEGALEGPYEQLTRRRIDLFETGRETGAPPTVVAEVIERALGDPDKKLRYIAPSNAELALAGRRRMSDEEWIAMGREMTDEEYAEESAKRFGR
jgi:NAD(P)-dependent dehydrogenase (short-subunit alcohol dehydrogenase family)